MKRRRLHGVGAHLALAGVTSGVILPWFIPPRVAAVIAVGIVVAGGVLFFGSGR